MNIITIDFETYYDRQFSLSKMTTEEYVRDRENFEVIGVAVKDGNKPTQWHTGSAEEIHEQLSAYNWGQSIALAHNAMFDAAILSWYFGIRPRGWADTLSMARPIHGTEVGGSLKALTAYYGIGVKGDEVVNALGKHRADFTPEELSRYAEYCINDVEITAKLFEILVEDFPPVELRLIDLTIRMYSEPELVLGKETLRSHLAHVQDVKSQLLDKALIDKDDLMSNPRLAEILRNFGVVPPMKISPTTGKETYAFSKTDEGFKALLEHESILVQAIVAARLGVKSTLEETRTERFLNIADRGKMPVPLRYYAAHTGRWGGDDKVNLQNLPRTSPLKYAIHAPKGYLLIDCDSSQIEARTLAWLAEQNDLVEAFDRGEDVYKIMAAAIYGKDIADITKDERFVGKTTILGAGYGMGAAKFQAQLKTFGVEVELEEAKRIIETYRETYPKIPALWKMAGTALQAIIQNSTAPIGREGVLSVEGTKGVKLPNGFYVKYPNLRQRINEESGNKYEYVYDTKKGKAVIPNRIYGGKVVENVCQALARIVIGEQMLMIAKKYKVVMTVHDAVACIVPEAEVERGVEYVELCMRLRPSWAPELPLNCESGFGKTYGEC
jgi:DNA polymerase I-like protein with 3'-5' exonuclease and polymerase domains